MDAAADEGSYGTPASGDAGATMHDKTARSSVLPAVLANNPYFSAGFGLMGLGAALAVGRQALVKGAEFGKRRLLVTLEIPSRDQSYLWFLHWMARQQARRAHHLAVETLYKKHDNGSATTRFSLVPGPGTHLIRWNGAWIQVVRQRDSKMVDLSTGSPWETVTLTTLSRDRHIFPQLLEDARCLASELQEGKTVVYTAWGTEWRPFGQPRRRRMMDSVILDKDVRERVVQDVIEFCSSSRWYYDRGIPYRRGYLLYGPPGSGKTSFVNALAGELQYNICALNLSERGLTDDKLNHLLNNLPERSIVLLEDVDAAFNVREQSKESGYRSTVTFSGLLNVLDGVASTEERIIFMTTNHAEKLDEALIRPGRVDVKVELGNASDHQIRELYFRFYPGHEDNVDLLIQRIRREKGTISMAELQGLFVYNKHNPNIPSSLTI